MDLDEQLAALAAGELDDDTARALRARAATDPAIARRLARHRQLQRLLEGWQPPAMSDQAVARLEARVDEALAALDDRPLADDRVVPLTPRPLADASDAEEPAGRVPAAGDRPVVDLGEARRRRGLPSWVPGAAVAAVLVAVVGTGIVVGGLPGGVGLDTMADSADAPADDAAQEEAGDAAADTEMLDDGAALLQGDTGGPMRRSDIVVAEGELLELVQSELAGTTAYSTSDGQALSSGESDGDDAGDAVEEDATAPAPAAGAAPADAQCVAEALERDTEQADGREVWLVGTGSYADEPAVFVVIRTPATPEDRFEVLAYDPADCDLLARDETTS